MLGYYSGGIPCVEVSSMASSLSKDLFDNLRLKDRVAIEGNDHPAPALLIDPMTAFGPQPTKPVFHSMASSSAAIRRGSFGMNFDCGGQNLLAQRRRALFISPGLQEEFNSLADIDQRLQLLWIRPRRGNRQPL
jgi:hypothetical protein